MLLRTKNLQIKGHPTSKLKPRWVGPFAVEKQIGAVAYRLTLPPSMKIHPTFYVSLLKRYQGEAPFTPAVVVDGELEYEVERIINHRHRHRRCEYLVKWRGYGPHENSWEPENNLGNAEQLLNEYKSAHALSYLCLFDIV